MSGPIFSFGPFVLDAERSTLFKRGRAVPLGIRGLLLLEALLRADGRVVTKDALRAAAWPRLAVEQSNLTVQIAKLRCCLGVTPDGQQWIATVPRVGYRFSRQVTSATNYDLAKMNTRAAWERVRSDAVPIGRPAYDLFLRGRAHALEAPNGRTSRPMLERSIKLDPGFARSRAWLALNYHFGWKYWGEPADLLRLKSRGAAEAAVALDPRNIETRWIFAYVRGYDGELADGLVDFETALADNPELADAWALRTDLLVLAGNPQGAIASGQRAFALNSHPPEIYFAALGWALYAAGHYFEAVRLLADRVHNRSGFQRILAASLAQLGRLEEARREASSYLEIVPSFTVSGWAGTRPFRNTADRAHFVDGYRRAGLPEH